MSSEDDAPSDVSETAVDICGRRYNIRGEHEPETIRELAAYVDRRMRQVSEQLAPGDAVSVAVLAALNIADDYLQTRRVLERREEEITERTRRLAITLNRALDPDERGFVGKPDE